MAARHITDPDIWWHLRTGQLILQNHAVFHTDPFSFTKFGQPWVNQEWLSEVIMALLYRAAGWSGIIVFFAAITSSSFMLVYLRCAGRPYLAAACAIWAAFCSAPAWGARPQIFSLLLASLFLLLLERSATNPKVLWYTPPLMLLWVNLHAGYAIGIAFMILFLLGDVLDIALGLELWSKIRRRFSILLVSCAASLAVVPLNPYGFRMYWYPLQTVDSPAMQNYISEWMSPNFHRGMYLPALLMILALLALAAVSSRRLRPTEILLLAFTLWAALHSARHVPIFALVAAPLIANLSEPLFAKMKIKQSSQEKTFKNQPFKSVLNGSFVSGVSPLRFHSSWSHSADARVSREAGFSGCGGYIPLFGKSPRPNIQRLQLGGISHLEGPQP